MITQDMEKKSEYFNQYVDAAFPYLAAQEQSNPMNRAGEIMERFFARGPMVIDRNATGEKDG